MAHMSVSNFVSGSRVPIFDLYGFVNIDVENAVPCQIKVGNRRGLETYIIRDRFCLDYLSTDPRQPLCLHRQPVPLQQDENGTYFFDACRFLMDQGVTPCLCSNSDCKHKKTHPFTSDTLRVTDYGGARCRVDWSGSGLVYSSLYFTLGTLTINGHSVRSISWESYDSSSDVSSDKNFALMPPFSL